MNAIAEKTSAAESSASQGGDEMIAAEGLTKYYGKFIAAENVTFSVPRGQVVAFLGPNGAGKSTTMKMLTGFLSPTRGKARIAGHDVYSDRLEAARLLGYLPENGPLYAEMTPKGFLNYCAQLRGMSRDQIVERLEYVVSRCSLASVWEKPIGKLSKGFRQRVGMAQAILHDPQVLILDEPTSGLDPNQTHQARELILSLAESKNDPAFHTYPGGSAGDVQPGDSDQQRARHCGWFCFGVVGRRRRHGKTFPGIDCLVV
jgi:ABC-2 type transport system ATP-binding protein